MFNHSHIRHFSSVFVSLCDFELIMQNSSENIASRQSRRIYVNGEDDTRKMILSRPKTSLYMPANVNSIVIIL